MKKYFILLIPFLISACANPINRYTATRYAEGCYDFQQHNEWWKARRACGRAAMNAQLGGVPDRTVAVLWYEYGRASGVICDYVEAQKGLEIAIKLYQAIEGPVHQPFLEMAKLRIAQGQFAEAIGYYDKVWQTLPSGIAEEQDPIGLAEVLEEQAEIYLQLGNPTLSKEPKERAQKLRTTNPNKTSRLSHTPYGKFCHQKS